MGFFNNGLSVGRKVSSRKSLLTGKAASRAIEAMERRLLMSATIGWDFGTTAPNASSDIGTPLNFTSGAYSLGNSYGTVTTPINTTSASSGYTGASGQENLGNSFNNSAANQTLTTSANPYYTVTLTPSSGYKVELDALTFGSRSTSTGPTKLDLRTSADGFATSIESLTISATSVWTDFTQTFTPVTGANNAPLEIRIYESGGSGTGTAGSGTENNRIDDVSISATGVSASAIVPSITGVSPASGYIGGQNTVLVSGAGFTAPTAVKFGAVTLNSSQYTVLSDTQLQVTVPTVSSPGQVYITVANTAGTSPTGTADQYTYLSTPVVSSVTPSTDSTLGGTTITVTGSGFTGLSAVSFGGKAGTNISSVTDTSFTVVDPSVSATGAVDIIVTANAGTSVASTTDKFTYVAPTTILSIENGVSSGTVVTLNDQPIVTQILTYPVAYHGNTYANYQFLVTDGTGSAEISYNASSQSYVPTVGDAINITGTYAPFEQIPEITPVTSIKLISSGNAVPSIPTATISQTDVPTIPTSLAGTVVTIKGVDVSGLSNADGVFEALNLTGTITDETGASETLYYYPKQFSTSMTDQNGNANLYGVSFPTNLVDITGIATVYTTGTTVLPEFVPLAITNSTVAPIVTKVAPVAGPLAGQNSVTITGYGFAGSADGTVSQASAVYFGGLSANFTVTNDNTIVAQVPGPLSAKTTVDVTVVAANGTTATGPNDKYTYTPAPVISSVSPIGGKAGVTSPGIVITGSGLLGVTSVTFGGVAATITNDTSDSSITVTAPAEAAGTVSVVVTKSGVGSSDDSNSSGTFTYESAPTIASLTPTSGGLTGGTPVTIKGTNFLAGDTTVTFGGVMATVTVTSATQLIATTPAGTAAGAVDVVVTTHGGVATSSAASGNGFTYIQNNVAAAEAAPSGTVVTINSSPVVTQILSIPGTFNGEAYTKYAFLIQDGSGSLEVFGTMPTGSTYVPAVGDILSLTGTYAPFNSIPELGTLTAITKTGAATSVPGPLTKTVPQVNATTLNISAGGVGEYMVTLNNVFISGITTATTFSGSTNLTGLITDASGNTITLYQYVTSYSTSNNNLNGMTIPSATTAVNITGIVDIYTSGTLVQPEFIPFTVTPAVTNTLPAWLSSDSVVSSYTPGQSITITSGTIINDPASVSGDSGIAITISGGTVYTNLPSGVHTIHAGSVTIATGSTLSLRYNATTLSTSVPVLLATSLNINANGSLDEANGDIDLVGGSVGTLNAYVAQGFAGGLWNGLGGIDSTVAAASHTNAIGVAPGGSVVSISGVTSATTDAVAKYTFFGDANLSGHVDGSDYSRIDSAFTVGGMTGWYNGDFNYDSKINGSDYTLIDNAFNMEGTTTIAAQVADADPVTHTAVPDSQLATITDATFSKKKLSKSIFEQLEQEITTN